MEEQECEVVFVSKESLKKENILEALGKGKLKQKEQQQHITEMRASLSKENVTADNSLPLSVKGEVSNKTSKISKKNKLNLKRQSSIKSSKTVKYKHTKIEKKERNRLKQKYLLDPEKKLFLKNDFEVGVTEYISQGQGFSALLNHCYSDFQVLYRTIFVMCI